MTTIHTGCECAKCGRPITERQSGESSPNGSIHRYCPRTRKSIEQDYERMIEAEIEKIREEVGDTWGPEEVYREARDIVAKKIEKGA